MELNVIRIMYYGLCMVGLSWYIMRRMKEGLCEEDIEWFLFVSILVIYLIPVILEVAWRTI